MDRTARRALLDGFLVAVVVGAAFVALIFLMVVAVNEQRELSTQSDCR